MRRLKLSRESLQVLASGEVAQIHGGLIAPNPKPTPSTPHAGCWTFWNGFTSGCGNPT